jgi:AraC-like DNA-binding protein
MNTSVLSVSDTDIAPVTRVREVADGMHIRLFVADALTIAAGRWNAQNVLDPYWRFYRNDNDGAYLRLGCDAGSRYPLCAGRVYFVPAGVRFSCANDADLRHFYVHFDVAGMPRLLASALFPNPVQVPEDSVWEAQVGAFAEAVRGTPTLDLAGQCRAKALVYEALARYLSAVLPDAAERLVAQAAVLEPVAPALEYIETHLAESLAVADLAARCCLSPDHFARRFRACLGQTPVAYVQARRVALAAQRLLFSDDSMEAIAESYGFGSRFYLTRVFTRVMGVPPAAYRKTGPRA